LHWDQSHFQKSISQHTIFSISPRIQNTLGCNACSVRHSTGNQNNRVLEEITPTYPRRLQTVPSIPKAQLSIVTGAKAPHFTNLSQCKGEIMTTRHRHAYAEGLPALPLVWQCCLDLPFHFWEGNNIVPKYTFAVLII
jgi:hypothetical protein